MAARGTEAPASAIPWDSVGPGWFVALWAPHAANEEFPPPPSWPRQVTTLYLVDPVGGRYRVARLPAPSYYGLLDWSGDGRRALIEVPPPGNRGAPGIEDLDLATGTVLHRFAGSADAGYQYTKPDGLAVLASSPPVDNGQGSIVRLGLSGSVELRYPTSFPGAGPLAPTLGGAGGVLPTLDGLELVVQLRDTMVLIANNGAFIRVVGPRRLGCSPDRWWAPMTCWRHARCRAPRLTGAPPYGWCQ